MIIIILYYYNIMKPSGNHKHDKDNIEGLHTHDFEDLGEEGIKLLIKGKLKNIPEFNFKKPKSEKQKKEAKQRKEERKQTKKEQLNNLINDIENNVEKFQTKKQIAQQSVGQNIPIYIPQYTPPTGKNLNVENLTEINDMILKKENQLREYYEEEFKKKWSEIEENYNILEQKEVERIRERDLQVEIPVIKPPIEETIQRPELTEMSQIEEFEKDETLQPPELIPTREFEYMPEEESLEDKVLGLLDIFDDEVLQKFKQADPKNKTLEEINIQQQQIINSKQNQLEELIEFEKDLKRVLNLDKETINRLESQLMEKIKEINLLTDENEKIKKIKEAEILSIQLDEANNITELNEEINRVKEERDKVKEELDNLKFMNLFEKDKATEQQQQLIEMNISEAEEILTERDTDGDYRKEFLKEYIPIQLVPKQKNLLNTIYETTQKILINEGEEKLREHINRIIETNGLNMGISNFSIELAKDIQPTILEGLKIMEEDLQKRIKEDESDESEEKIEDVEEYLEEKREKEEEKQLRIIKEMAEEADNEQNISELTEAEERRKNILMAIEKLKEQRNEIENDINEKEQELNDFIDEYEGMILTYETELQDKGIEEIGDIDEIENELERESLLSLNNYINETKNELEKYIDEIKQKLVDGKLLLDRKEIQILEYEEDLDFIDNQIEILKEELL